MSQPDLKLEVTIRNDDRGRVVSISSSADWALFDEIAHALSLETGGTWVERLDGLDERYWDLRIGEATVTLHLQHYLGIMLFAEDPFGSEATFDRIIAVLSAYQPSARDE
jgi:hypothetical protein